MLLDEALCFEERRDQPPFVLSSVNGFCKSGVGISEIVASKNVVFKDGTSFAADCRRRGNIDRRRRGDGVPRRRSTSCPDG